MIFSFARFVRLFGRFRYFIRSFFAATFFSSFFPHGQVKKWNEQPPIMYSVRVRPRTPKATNNAADGYGDPGTPKSDPLPATPRRPLHSSFTVGRIDLDEDQLGSGRVLLVDDRNGHIYLWCGNMSTFKHRGFGLEAATRVKADSPKGGQVCDPCFWLLVGVDFLSPPSPSPALMLRDKGAGWGGGGGAGVGVERGGRAANGGQTRVV